MLASNIQLEKKIKKTKKKKQVVEVVKKLSKPRYIHKFNFF